MTFINIEDKREFIENSIIAIVIIFVGIVATVANGQEEKIPITVACTVGWCLGEDDSADVFLIKVWNPVDYELIGEKKFTGDQLSNDKANIYLDKKWMGKELEFETIDMDSGESSLKYAYIVEPNQWIELIEPS